MKDSKAICFYRAHISEFLDPNPKMKWVELENDLAVGSVKDSHKAGLISFKLAINNKTKNGSIDFS